MNIHNHDKRSRVPLLNGSADLTIDIESGEPNIFNHNSPECKRNGDVTHSGHLSPRESNGVKRKTSDDVIYQGDLSQRDARSGGFATQHLLSEKSYLVNSNQQSPTHQSAREKKSPTVSLLTRLARKKLRRKKYYYTTGCEYERNCVGGSCGATSVCAAGEDYNYEYIACDRCGGYKVSALYMLI